MQTSQQTIDSANATVRRNEYVCPAFTRVCYPAGICYCFQCSHDSCTNGNDALMCKTRCVDEACCWLRYMIILFIYRLFLFCAGNSCVQKEGSYLNTPGNQASQQFRGEGTPGRWHLCATHLRCKNRLIVAQRPPFFHIAIANWEAIPVKVGMKRSRHIKARNPETAKSIAGCIGRMECYAGTGRHFKGLSRLDIIEWPSRFLSAVLIGTHFYYPEVRRQMSGELKFKLHPIGACGWQCGVQRPASINHQHISRL